MPKNHTYSQNLKYLIRFYCIVRVSDREHLCQRNVLLDVSMCKLPYTIVKQY